MAVTPGPMLAADHGSAPGGPESAVGSQALACHADPRAAVSSDSLGSVSRTRLRPGRTAVPSVPGDSRGVHRGLGAR